MTASATIFDVLNARYIAPDRVAETFIAPSQFQTLVRPGNALLVGARGTGKTTLLKMLKLPAFQNWRSPNKQHYLSYFNYISAFISNDRNWSSRINDFARQFESTELQTYARLALVSNQALRAVVKSVAEIFNHNMAEIPFLARKRVDNLSAEIQFSQRLSSHLFETHRFVTTADIEFELGRRVDRLIEDANAMRFAGESERSVAQKHRWIFSEFLGSLRIAVSLFRETSGLQTLPWCLCFDELELAHDDVRNLLFGFLRSADPFFYFKLATVPFMEDISAFQSKNAPTVQHDFSVVELWNVKKDQGDQFMYDLANSTIQLRGLMNTSLEMILGNSFDSELAGNAPVGRYSRQSKFFANFMALADYDPTFRKYLMDRGIGVHDFYRMSEDRRAAIFRKVQNIVVLRSAFFSRERVPNLRNAKPMSRRRSSRGFVYSGAQNAVDICDNNPRFLLAILDPLLTEYERSNTRIKPEIQLDAINQVANQVSSVLKGEAIYPPYARLKSVGDLVQRLGRFFQSEIHDGAFNPDPVLSFTIPWDAPNSVIKAVGFAIREGAMLLEGEYTGSYLRDGLANKRIRLAYLFAPEFLLPLMLGRHRHIEGILRTDLSKRRQKAGSQTDLFASESNE